MCLAGKPLFAAAEHLVFGWLAIEELAQVFWASQPLAKSIRRWLKAGRLVLCPSHFPSSSSSRFAMGLLSSARCSQLHLTVFPSASENASTHRSFALRWLARVLENSRDSLRSFQWQDRRAPLHLAHLQAVTRCPALTDLDLTSIAISPKLLQDNVDAALLFKHWLTNHNENSFIGPSAQNQATTTTTTRSCLCLKRLLCWL